MSRALRLSLPVLAGALLLGPFIVRQNAWWEWANYLWLLQQQEESVRATGWPSFFVHADEFGVFYPHFLFYGGGLWGATAYLAIGVGSAWTAFVLVLMGAYAMAYGGMLWLGRAVGLDPLAAHAPALAVVLSPYFVVGNLYGKGAWAEIVAISALPLVLAGTVDVIRRGPRLRSVAAIGVAGAIVGASHPPTLMWGTLFVAAVALAAGWLLAAPIRASATRAITVAAAWAGGVAVNAWFVLPAIVLTDQTQGYKRLFPVFSGKGGRLDVILSPLPTDFGAQHLPLQLPLYVAVWLLVGLVLCRRAISGRARRAVMVLGTGAAILVGLILLPDVWTLFPRAARATQFTWRLHAYLAIVLACLVVVVLLSPRAGRWRAALPVALALQAVFAGLVTLGTDAEKPLRHDEVVAAKVPGPFGGDQQNDYRSRVPAPVAKNPDWRLPVAAVEAEDSDAVVRGPGPPRATGAVTSISTNVVYSDLVEATGALRIVGRDAGGFAILELGRGEPAAPWTAHLEARRPFWPVGAGLWGSITTAALWVLALVAVLVRRTRRVRPSRGTEAAR